MPGADDKRPWRKLYGSRWQRERLRYLAKHPLCVRCQDRGRLVPATVVDHVRPHRGDLQLFWSPTNRQALCKACHDGWKQSLEKAPDACRIDGYPKDGGW
ncbi:HNH endonuclease signature motif containing protein [Hyphomicrobium sulfonivorans]|uniref:HNH endonuclease signature motif containing protein n=1 Tax=Hyphomicrobium sulfonivorans TaxID=121290 RepID=UPI0009F8403E|nr:HNH endonuclease signature motif containing protein [Hyphomicrobium sulfonivorans]